MVREKITLAILFFALLLAGTMIGCTTPDLERAFGPEMKLERSNKIINKYCLSCHVHRGFNQKDHVEKVHSKYTDEPYRSSTECRTCHTYSRNWMMDVKRGTHWPAKEK